MRSSPPPPDHPRDTLIRHRCLIAIRPRGDIAFEGVVMRIEHDGYWMHGSIISELTLWEADEDGDVTKHGMQGDVWIDRSDVLYVNRLPATGTDDQ